MHPPRCPVFPKRCRRRKPPSWQIARHPDSTGATSKTGHPNSLSCPQFGYNWNYNHRMASITTTDFRKHLKPHHTDRNRKHPTHAPDRTHLRDGSPKRRQAGAQKLQWNAEARPLRCAGVPGRHERFRRRRPKAHPDSGRPDWWSGTGTICPIGRDKCSRFRSHYV